MIYSLIMDARKKKQSIIAVVYLVIFALFLWWVYAIFLRVPQTCSDDIKNQDEVMVDCGGVCGGVCQEKVPVKDMMVQEKAVVYGGQNESDVLIKVYNPNDLYGAESFRYTVTIKDAMGATVAQKSDTSFILPKETKYLIQIGLPIASDSVSADIVFESIDWKAFSGYQEKPVFSIVNKRYGPVISGVGFGQADGTLVNESGFDFQTIVVKVVLRDASAKPVAINQTKLRTVVANERRDIGPLLFPAYFPGEVMSVETDAEADVYHSENFIRQYLPSGDFQKLQ
jgi:hypothetical protein